MLYSVTGNVPLQLSSVLELELYDKVETEDGTVLKHSKASEKEYGALLQKQVRGLRIGANAKHIDMKDKPYRKQAEGILPVLSEAASALARAIVTGAPVIVRFHNEGDGASGAVALYRAAECLQSMFEIREPAFSWRMNRRIAYGTEEFDRDRMFFSQYRSIEKPVLLITDLGTSPESVQALEAMQKTATVIVVDHHPPYPGFPRNAASIYVNGWDHGADSDFTAGLLSCLLAELLCKVDVEDLKEASLVCDYSTYAKADAASKKDALILDFLTVSRLDSVKPAGINAVLTDKERRDEVFMRASGMQEEALAEGVRSVNRYRTRTGINVFVLDFGRIAALNLEFPPLGRMAAVLQKRLESLNSLNTVTIVYSRSNISLRVSGDIADKVRMLDVISRVKKSVDYEISGGGHIRASGMRVDSSRMQDTIDLLLAELGVEKR